MHKFSILAAAVLATAVPTIAQGCSGPATTQQFSNRELFAVNYYYQMSSYMFDIDAQVDLSINSMSTWNYDQGVGNPVVPNQVGGTGPVDVYLVPTTMVGSETIDPNVTPGVWLPIGSGITTIAAYPAETQIVFSTPIVIPAGQWGVAMVFGPTTTGPNPGLVQHCLAIAATPVPTSDQFMTMSNQFLQGTAWTGTTGGNPNLRINYDVPATSAYNLTLGEGCYFRPQTFYEAFPGGATPDIAGTTQLWIYQPPAAPNGANYLIVPGASVFTPPASPSLTLTPPVSSSSGNWDDALSDPITLPFTFNFPGGSTNEITIGSNGCIYLDSVVDSTYDICGSYYGSLARFVDGPPRICAFLVDLDPDPTTGSGGLHYDVAAGNGSVTITWDSVQEWGVPANVNSIQVILSATGDVEIVYGTLASGVGDDGLYGFTTGNGAIYDAPIDINPAYLAGYATGNDAKPPILTADSRAVIGSSPSCTTSNLTTGTLVGALAVGTSVLTPALDLTSIGMPGCSLHSNFFVVLTQLVDPVTGNFEQPLLIPNNPALQSQTIVLQSAPLTPGFNQLGLLTSNGLCMRIGS